ncbi:2-amino-4-hydroxy-6-hydroxymethyldihydropteridine diphosphokinase [Magnetospirillum sulfuroxidans]|uniref:2-amino-4-hydroxy-6-hydroxymethyldihydropteridine pyrophosphokinase n=1 Tax=Magnetospirillum sulfuroxidans TaxID=611300 RepID=A0ABS5ICH3_9PROT|nr:2-amino-4-hydroxy-6-hydroxymethyldihydropteridine diphosphokinase [Magnetospirillum sulfuroxidans]MBR9972126.1 2-amino-4-hydroxy-6-hydroxymethyldihydropteridine diphosphokinase [Magnetospirillum sulfuroxidans]
MASVYLGLGTNLGDRAANLRTALAALSQLGQVARLSRVYETAPLYVTDQPAFLNMAACLETALAPQALLGRLKVLEDELGRVASRRYGPRLIDLDILLHGDNIVDLPQLSIPHPRLTERRFALAPLADLAADVIHPVAGLTIAQLLAALPADDDDQVIVVDNALI